MTIRTIPAAAGAFVALLLLIAGCSNPTPSSESASAAPLPPSNSSPNTGPTSAPTAPVEAGKVAEHVHNLAIDGQSVLLGTHEGLFRQEPSQPVLRISEQPFDVMGLARSGQAWLASGHPGAGMDGPADLGLLESTDGGATWQPRSLYGEVDFHRLTVSGRTVMGLSAHDGALLRSSDNGFTWTEFGRPPLFDLALNPQDPQVVVGTTTDGPMVSQDGGRTFEPISGAPLLALLAWTDTALYAVDPGGQVLISNDNGATWTPRGRVTGEPVALAAGGDGLAVLAEGTVFFSTDGGTTFYPRITGLAGH